MRTNLALEHAEPQGVVVTFPKKERHIVFKKEESYTKMPNLLIDDQIMAQLNDKAFKCLMFIIRQTLGFDRISHSISITQFQKYCGIKKRDTVMSCVKELEDRKLIQVYRKSGCLNTYSLVQKQSCSQNIDFEETHPVLREETGPAKGAETRPLKGGANKEQSKENFKENINAVFAFWKTVFGKTEKVVLSDKRRAKILARLKQGYTVEEIKQAIVNCSQSDYHIKNAYTDIELICREPEKLDRFLNMRHGPKNRFDVHAMNVNKAWECQAQFTATVEQVVLEEWMQ
jgi:phage replication O-like protein O